MTRADPTLWLSAGLIAWACDAVAPATPPPSLTESGVALVCTDYASSAIAVLDSEAVDTLTPMLIHSGSVAPRVQAALGGDVVLGSTQPRDGTLWLVDRYPNSVLTRVDASSGAVVIQHNVGSGFAANPHDAFPLEGGRLLVTRYNANPRPEGGAALDRGDDVLLLGPDGEWIAALPLGEASGPARPDRMAPGPDGSVWVTLNRVALDFKSYQTGQVARLRVSGDGDTLLLESRLDLATVKNCGAVASGPSAIAVAACSGSFDTDREAYDTATSGLVLLGTGGDEIALLPPPGPGSAFGPAVAIDLQGRVLALVVGPAGTPDRVTRWDPGTSSTETVYQAAAPWSVSAVAVTPAGVPIFTDASAPAGLLCRAQGAVSCTAVCQAAGLPPRGLAGF